MVTDPLPDQTLATVLRRDVPHLRLLVLFGSRGRGDAHAGSDWDFGYCCDPGFDPADLRARLVEALRTERIDLVDLDRAGGLLRFRAARDGRPLVDSNGHFAEFAFAAARFWCENQRLFERGYEDLLRGAAS